MVEIRIITGTCLPVRGDDIDTDRIIPARFMKGVTFDDLGQYAFYDARRDSEGELMTTPFNDIRYQGASILLVNRNFRMRIQPGARPQALIRSGIRAIIGESFAEIFIGNCTANGVPVVTLDPETMSDLMEYVEVHSDEYMNLDISTLTLIASAGTEFKLTMDSGRQQSLLNGSWDTFGEMLSNLELTKAVRERLAARIS